VKNTEVPFAVLRFQYQLARFPLQLIEERVVARMSSETPARLLYERSIGMIDRTVGTALGAPELEQRGAALVERSEALGRAAKLDAAASRTVKEADVELKDARAAAAEVREQASADKEDELKQARVDAAHQKVEAIRNAEDRVADVTKQADEVAAQRKDAVEAAKRREQDEIRANEQSVAAAADAKTKDARKKRSDAATKRGQANRVEQLADVEKQKRRSDRTNDG
jgi:hypothetical protein